MSWVLDHLSTLAIGYALCICVPCPFISSWVLRGWNDAGEWLRSKL